MIKLRGFEFLRCVYKGWIFVGNYVGWVNTRILLAAVYFLVMLPIALFLRIVMRRRFLDLDFRSSRTTYARSKLPRERESFELQF